MNVGNMLTAQEMVTLSDDELDKLLKLGDLPQLYIKETGCNQSTELNAYMKHSVRNLWVAACRVSFPVNPLISLSSLVDAPIAVPKLRILDPKLDRSIISLLPSKGIIDVAGEASSGKTQLSLQLLLDCITPAAYGGLGKGALYIFTEGDFASKRWEQLKGFRMAKLAAAAIHVPLREESLLLQKVASVDAFEVLLTRMRPLLRAHDCAFVIIDSIATLARELPSDRRQDTLYRWVSHLQQTSDDIGIPILTINQVIDFFEEPPGSIHRVDPRSSLGIAKRHSSFMASDRRVVPALGLAWSELVNARIVVTRTSQRYDGPVVLSRAPDETFVLQDLEPAAKRRKLDAIQNHSWNDATVVIRQLSIMFSPCSAQTQAEFFVDGEGLHSAS